MKLIKPKFWESKNFISFILYPLSAITFLINFTKKFSIKKNFEIKSICIGNIFIGGTGKTSLAIEINDLLRKKFRTVFIKKNYKNQIDEINLLNNKGKIIFSLQEKIKKLELEVKELKMENKQLREDNKQIKENNKQLNKKIDILMRNHYYIILSEAIKTIQYYIIQTTTGYDNTKMETINLNLDEFLKNKDNEQYTSEIEKLIEKFEMNKYKTAISKIINKRNDARGYEKYKETEEYKQKIITK